MQTKPEATRPQPRIASLFFLVMAVLAWLVLLYCLTVSASRFRGIFKDLLGDRALPILTELFLKIPAAVSIILVTAVCGSLLLMEKRIADKKQTMFINLSAFFVAGIITALVICSFFMPLMTTISALSK